MKTDTILHFKLLHSLCINNRMDTLDIKLKQLRESDSDFDIDYSEKPANTLFHTACSNGKLGVMMYLQKQGADIFKLTPNGLNYLSIVAHTGEVGIAQWLVQQGLKPQDGSEKFLWFAIGKPHMLNYGLSLGLSPNEVDKYGESLLQNSLGYPDLASFKVLLKYNAIIDTLDNHGNNLLMTASHRGRPVAIRQLLKKIDINAQNDKGETAYMMAVEKGRFPSAKILKKSNYNIVTNAGNDIVDIMVYAYKKNVSHNPNGGKKVENYKKCLELVIENIPDNYHINKIDAQSNTLLFKLWQEHIFDKNIKTEWINNIFTHPQFSAQQHLEALKKTKVMNQEDLEILLKNVQLKNELEASLPMTKIKPSQRMKV